MKRALLAALVASLLLAGCLTQPTEAESISVAAWNLQVYGQSKASNASLLNDYAAKIKNYEIVFVQEIRDKSGTAFPALCSRLLEYDCLNSSRAGSTSSKEQYGVIYKHGVEVIGFHDYNPELEQEFERAPLSITLETKGYEFTVLVLHARPDAADEEIEKLESIASELEGNVIVLGDLNADCNYYDYDGSDFAGWLWAINEDTTVSKTDCAYDRIILNADASQEFVAAGIDRDGITSEHSDHYLVWAKLKIN